MPLRNLVSLADVEKNILAALLNSGVSKDTDGGGNDDTLGNLSGRHVSSELLSRTGEQDLEHVVKKKR